MNNKNAIITYAFPCKFFDACLCELFNTICHSKINRSRRSDFLLFYPV
jgi:hypothetical protein